MRLANYSVENTGAGHYLFGMKDGTSVSIVISMGHVFIDSIDCPFIKADAKVKPLHEKTNIIFVDMHAYEVTSEKFQWGVIRMVRWVRWLAVIPMFKSRIKRFYQTGQPI